MSLRPPIRPALWQYGSTLLTVTQARSLREYPSQEKGVELDLLVDYDQHLFIEKGTRGGIFMVSRRYARANNSRVEGYDPKEPNIFIPLLGRQ